MPSLSGTEYLSLRWPIFIGFVAMSIFTTYYALTPRVAEARLATLHYILTTLTVIILTPGIVL